MLHKNILRIRDENGLGDVSYELNLTFDRVQVSVRDIITERVTQEVTTYNRKAVNYQHALVRPTETEARLNGAKAREKRHVDVDKQVEVAIKAFLRNGFFILVDDLQVEDLEQTVVIKPETTVSFVKLTPLVGG